MTDPLHHDTFPPTDPSEPEKNAPFDRENSSPGETTAKKLAPAELASAELDTAELDAVNDPDDELMTAYLDGELSEEEKARVERRLDGDEALSARLAKLRSAAKLIDSLDTIPLNDRLTASTMELLSAFVQKEIAAARKKQLRHRWIAFAVLAALGLLAFLIGSRLTDRFESTNRVSEKDAPVIARLESLEIVGDFDFLTDLANAKLFTGEATGPKSETVNGVPSPSPKNATGLLENRPGNAALRTPDQTEMFLLTMRFQRLSESEKKKYRTLYRQIESAPNRGELLALLDLFGRWFWYDLHETDRYAYWQTPENERLAAVERLLTESRRPSPPLPISGPPADGPPAARHDVSDFHGGNPHENPGARDFGDPRGGYRPRDLRPSLPEELRGEKLDDIGDELFTFVREKFKEGPFTKRKEEMLLAFISEKGVDTLITRLSEAGQKYLAPMDEEQKIQLIGLLILVELHEKQFRMRVRGGDRRRGDFSDPNRTPNDPPDLPPYDRFDGGPDGPNAGFYWKTESTRELAETLKKLPQEKRDELLSLPDEELYSRLLILHWGFDPKQARSQPTGLPQVGKNPPAPRNWGDRREDFREDRREDFREENSPRPDSAEPTDSWKRFLDEKKKNATLM